MRHATRAEKAFGPGKGAVDELIHNHEVARRHLFAERPAGADADHIGDAQPFQRVDVGAVGHI